MGIVSYGKVIDNCMHRTAADLSQINRYIEKYDWENIIIKRHQVFIERYINNEYNMNKTAKESNYSERDMLSIFLRIQSQFELYEDNAEVSFGDLIVSKDEIPRHHSAPKEVKTEQIVVEKMVKKAVSKKAELKPAEPMLNPQTGNVKKDAELMSILQSARKVNNLKEVIGDTMFGFVELLLQGKTIKEVAEAKQRKERYLLQTIMGAKNPRNRCELGLKRLIENRGE